MIKAPLIVGDPDIRALTSFLVMPDPTEGLQCYSMILGASALHQFRISIGFGRNQAPGLTIWASSPATKKRKELAAVRHNPGKHESSALSGSISTVRRGHPNY